MSAPASFREWLRRPPEGLSPDPRLCFMDQCHEVMRFKRLAERTEQVYYE